MNGQAPPRATYQGVLDAPGNQVAELVDGTLHLHPRPASRHARATFRLAMKLGAPYDDGVGGTLEASGLQGGALTLLAAVGSDDVVRVAPLEATGFPLSALWP